MSIWTLIIAIGKIGVIWATKRTQRKIFQTVVSVAVMMAVINFNKSKKENGRKRV